MVKDFPSHSMAMIALEVIRNDPAKYDMKIPANVIIDLSHELAANIFDYVRDGNSIVGVIRDRFDAYLNEQEK